MSFYRQWVFFVHSLGSVDIVLMPVAVCGGRRQTGRCRFVEVSTLQAWKPRRYFSTSEIFITSSTSNDQGSAAKPASNPSTQIGSQSLPRPPKHKPCKLRNRCRGRKGSKCKLWHAFLWRGGLIGSWRSPALGFNSRKPKIETKRNGQVILLVGWGKRETGNSCCWALAFASDWNHWTLTWKWIERI